MIYKTTGYHLRIVTREFLEAIINFIHWGDLIGLVPISLFKNCVFTKTFLSVFFRMTFSSDTMTKGRVEISLATQEPQWCGTEHRYPDLKRSIREARLWMGWKAHLLSFPPLFPSYSTQPERFWGTSGREVNPWAQSPRGEVESQSDRADKNQVGPKVHSGVFVIPCGKTPAE